MECDFPAAHSMDSTWFAVDRDGHVAVFDTGEAGAMPAQAATDDQEDLSGKLSHALPRTGARRDPAAGLAHPGDSDSVRHRTFYDNQTKIEGVLMFLESLDPVEDELNRGELFEVEATQGVAVIWRELSRKSFRRLHEQGDCLYCTYGSDEEDDEEGEPEDEAWVMPPNLANFGFYSYTHVTDNWVAGPYARDHQPVQPTTIDQIPANLRGLVRRVRFDNLSFRDTPALQPVEHVKCEAWGAAYLASDGKSIRPIPGREKDYARECRDYMADESYIVEPPTAGMERHSRPGSTEAPAAHEGGLLARLFRFFRG